MASAANNGYLAAFAAHHSVGGSARPITLACRYTDNSASTSDAADADEVGAGAPSMASSTSNGPARAFFAGGGCGVLAGGFDGSNRASSIAHCLVASSPVSDAS